MAETILSIDFETASLLDLRRTGAKLYSMHPSTRVLCMSYSFDRGKTVHRWRIGTPFPQAVLEHVANARRVRAWNASFEWHIWNNTLLRQIGAPEVMSLSLAQLDDTMAAAAYWGLPLSLDAAGPAIGLSITKDKDGHRLMMQMCKPRRVDPVAGTASWWHEDDPAKLERLMDYCDRDVEVEAGVAERILSLPDAERRVWVMDQLINDRGVGLDLDLVLRLKNLAEVSAQRANDDMARLTHGAVRTVTSAAALLSYLKDNTDYPEDNLRRATIEARLDEPDCTGLERDLLELRIDAARTSAAKLQAMLDACGTRGEIGSVYGMLQYYGASRTGRWAGRLIQMQNMPRGVIKNVDAAISMIKAGADVDMIEAIFGPAMGVISSCLRGCIVARKDRHLVVADFSQIEARVLPWLAGQNDILQVFASGRDVYIYTAAKTTGKPEGSINKDDPLRQFGKVLVLACGYGMSGKKFRATAEGYRVYLSEAEADQAVKDWRNANTHIVQFWWDCDSAARAVIQGNQKVVDVGAVRFAMLGRDLCVRLPSGRILTYRDAKVRDNPDRPGSTEITYMGIDQYTRRWTRLRTYGGKLVENIVQAVARDLMAHSMQEAERQGIRDIILTVHDEMLAEEVEDKAEATLNQLLSIMSTSPQWAADLPLEGAGWHGPRYKKD